MARARNRPGPKKRKQPAKRKAPAKRKPAAKPRRDPDAPKRRKAATAAKLKASNQRAWRLGYAMAHMHEPRREISTLAQMPVVTDFDDVEAYHLSAHSVHQSLPEAEAALAEARKETLLAPARRSAFTSGLSLGLSIVAVLGVGLVLVYILFRKKDETGSATILQAPPQIIQLKDNQSQPVIDVDVIEPEEDIQDETAIETTTANPIENIASAIVAALRQERDTPRDMRTFMQSFSLPYIGDPNSESIRVVTAGNEPFEVVVRCVEPPGSHAILAFDPVELNIPGGLPFTQTVGGAYSEFPVGNVLPVPAGQFQIIRMRPRQALYAKGTVSPTGANQSTASGNGVILAVTAADFISGINW